MDVEQAITESHHAWDEFVRGNPEPAKAMYSRNDDVTLANPFGATVRGWDKVSEALAYAASRFRDGDLKNVERVSIYQSGDLVTIFERESYQAKVGETAEAAPIELRVSTSWRREDDAWRIVHRHADNIHTFDSSGPLRAT